MEARESHTSEIISNAQNISLEMNAAAASGTGNTFCKAWPSTQVGLELLKGVLKDPIAKAAVSIAITAGETVSAKICKK